jgi:rhodanese-related sulfurtransferase
MPLDMLLADSAALSPEGSYLLLCASGKRSLTAARELRKRGFDAHSLAGGLQALQAAEPA